MINTGQKPRRASVSVIIPNYNGGERIEKCVQSVLAQSHAAHEILIVDNASSDGSDKMIRERFPEIKFIQNGYNAGWGIACNIGLSQSTGEYLLMLNNDAYMEPDCVEQMVLAIEKNPRYGACASRILLWDEPKTAEVCGLVIYRDGSSCGRGRLGPADGYMNEEEVFCANDCCALFRRSMFDEIGNYDPDFFIYCDETDIGWRHQIAGWKCVYTPKAVAYHAHSLTAGSYSPFKAFHVERNRIYICFKYFPIPHLIASFFYSIARFLCQLYLSYAEKEGALNQFLKTHSLGSGFFILVKAHFAALGKLPVMWRRRKEIKTIKKISDQDIEDLFIKYGITARQMAGYK